MILILGKIFLQEIGWFWFIIIKKKKEISTSSHHYLHNNIKLVPFFKYTNIATHAHTWKMHTCRKARINFCKGLHCIGRCSTSIIIIFYLTRLCKGRSGCYMRGVGAVNKLESRYFCASDANVRPSCSAQQLTFAKFM